MFDPPLVITDALNRNTWEGIQFIIFDAEIERLEQDPQTNVVNGMAMDHLPG